MRFDVRPLDPLGSDVDRWAEMYRDLLIAAGGLIAAGSGESAADVAGRVRAVPPDDDTGRFAAHLDDGRLIGVAQVRPDRPDASYARLFVRTDFRRRGVGRALAGACADWASARGRTAVRSVVFAGRPDEAFTAALGATVLIRLVTVSRSLDAPAPDVPTPAGLTPVRWTAGAPEALLDDYAALKRAVGDAPDAAHQMDVRHRTAGWVREWERQAGYELWVSGLLDGGRLVAFTEVGVPAGSGASQHDTAVDPGYRGRGLATRIKADMIDWVRAERAQVVDITSTINLRNAPMLAVCDRLGYARIRERRLVHWPVVDRQ